MCRYLPIFTDKFQQNFFLVTQMFLSLGLSYKLFRLTHPLSCTKTVFVDTTRDTT